MKIVKASRSDNKSDLEDSIRDIIDEELCLEVVNLAFSEDGLFSKDVFTDSDTFFDTLISDEPMQVALMFFNGDDLDTRGSANPTREYFRMDSSDNVESTDDPGAIYYKDLLDDIVDYIMEHTEDREFPEDIQEIIDDYTDKE